MSSCTRFLSQIPAGLQFVSLPAITSVYEFYPSSSNTVGNYPPGLMVQASAGNAPAFYGALQGSGAYSGASAQPGYLLRDMGKTVKALVAASEAAAATGTADGTTAEQHYRMYQIVKPGNGAFGINGSTASGNFKYMTVFLPTQITLSGGLIASANQQIGGSM